MDTSKEYIEMCREAEEVQEGKHQDGVSGVWVADDIVLSTSKEYGQGDYYYVLDKEGNRKCKECGNEESYIVSTKSSWLPRQDQLQKMVDWKRFDEITIGWHTSPYKMTWQDDPLHEEGVNGESMEQLWLAFVMKEKYNKIWNGKDWVKA